MLAWFKMLKNETFLEIFHHCASIVNKPFPSCHLLSYRVSRKDLLQIDDVNQIKTPTNYGVCLLPFSSSEQKSVWNKSLATVAETLCQLCILWQNNKANYLSHWCLKINWKRDSSSRHASMNNTRLARQESATFKNFRFENPYNS